MEIQYAIDEIIYKMASAHGNLYAVIKEILRIKDNLDIGGVRKPLPDLIPADIPIVKDAVELIEKAVEKYC
jgi:N-acetylneuraminate lyase